MLLSPAATAAVSRSWGFPVDLASFLKAVFSSYKDMYHQNIHDVYHVHGNKNVPVWYNSD